MVGNRNYTSPRYQVTSYIRSNFLIRHSALYDKVPLNRVLVSSPHFLRWFRPITPLNVRDRSWFLRRHGFKNGLHWAFKRGDVSNRCVVDFVPVHFKVIMDKCMSHNGIASLSTCLRKRSRIPASLITSTLTPSRSCNSMSSPPWSRSDRSG